MWEVAFFLIKLFYWTQWHYSIHDHVVSKQFPGTHRDFYLQDLWIFRAASPWWRLFVVLKCKVTEIQQRINLGFGTFFSTQKLEKSHDKNLFCIRIHPVLSHLGWTHQVAHCHDSFLTLETDNNLTWLISEEIKTSNSKSPMLCSKFGLNAVIEVVSWVWHSITVLSSYTSQEQLFKHTVSTHFIADTKFMKDILTINMSNLVTRLT